MGFWGGGGQRQVVPWDHDPFNQCSTHEARRLSAWAPHRAPLKQEGPAISVDQVVAGGLGGGGKAKCSTGRAWHRGRPNVGTYGGHASRMTRMATHLRLQSFGSLRIAQPNHERSWQLLWRRKGAVLARPSQRTLQKGRRNKA